MTAPNTRAVARISCQQQISLHRNFFRDLVGRSRLQNDRALHARHATTIN